MRRILVDGNLLKPSTCKSAASYGRATRLATGTGWKPVERESVLWVQLPLLPLWPDPVLVSGDRL